jgi:xylulokinase
LSLLGIDLGTTGCKAGAIDENGRFLALAYREYEMLHPQPGWAELDSQAVWGKVKEVIKEVAAATKDDPITAVSSSSMGEAMTPVSADRQILGNCLIGFDSRGDEYVAELAVNPGRERLHALNGNILGGAYSAPKLAWLRDHDTERFQQAYKYLLWGGLVGYLLGGEATTDLSLANRTLLLDLHKGDWSPEMLQATGISLEKLPKVVPAGTLIGQVDDALAAELGLAPGAKIVAGAHDQNATALGAGVVKPGLATYGMGTFITVAPVYDTIPPSQPMLDSGMNIEHHVIPGLYISFLFNTTGGSALRWVRDTMAHAEHMQAIQEGWDIYDRLMTEMPDDPTNLLVLPHFAPCGPPTFDAASAGVIAGLKLETSRGEVTKGILEGVTYYFAEGLDLLAQAGLEANEFRATGGGAKSDAWLQLTADVLGQPIARLEVNECGVLGAAILAGVGSGVFTSAAETAESVVEVTRWFEPSLAKHNMYLEKLVMFKQLYPQLKDTLHQL